MLPADVSAVVCTMNSIAGIEMCLRSLREAGVGELIVVDAGSTDGTRFIADLVSDLVLDDPGTGLGNARNIGIARTSKPLVLNMGSDNVMPLGQLERMISDLEASGSHGVSARTIIQGSDYVSRGLNAWRQARFVPGAAKIIGTPTLLMGDRLRKHPFDSNRVFSDDSELCERWAKEFGSTFAISEAYVFEVGKTSWNEVVTRCRMYGISDDEVFRAGRSAGWSIPRQIQSLIHPARADMIQPLAHLPPRDAVLSAPFLATFAAMRYYYWGQQAISHRTRA